jgi:purine-binding chemotaxis protein CheW
VKQVFGGFGVGDANKELHMDALTGVKPATGQHLTFMIADEEYAVNILKVKEIIEFEMITAVPNTAPWIRGVTNLRGNVVPVIDLAVKFGLPASKASKLSCIVITEIHFENENLTLGVMADSVNQVVDFSEGDVEFPPSFGTRVKIEYLTGMGKMGKKFCLILDIDKVLSSDELLAASDAATDSSREPSKPETAFGATAGESGV